VTPRWRSTGDSGRVCQHRIGRLHHCVSPPQGRHSGWRGGRDLRRLRAANAALALLLFVALLALIDEGLAAGQHEVHHPRQLVGWWRCWRAACPCGRTAGDRTHPAQSRCAHRLIAAIFSAWRTRLAERLVLRRQHLAAADLRARAQPSQEQKCLTVAKRLRSGPISLSIFITDRHPSPLMRVRSTPAQLASAGARQTRRGTCCPRAAPCPDRPGSPRSASSACSLASHSARWRRCRRTSPAPA
jgi:hypothetical protein